MFDYNLTWKELSLDEKREFAKLYELNLDNISDEYDLSNIWHSNRYHRGYEN